MPDGAPELSADGLSVRLHPDFPQVVDYRLGDAQLAGKLCDPLTQVTIDEKPYDVTVAAPTGTGASATYALSVADLDVTFNVTITVADGVLSWTITDVNDPDSKVHRIAVPGLDLVSVTAAQQGSIITSKLGVSRSQNPDTSLNVATAEPSTHTGFMVGANEQALAAGFMSNAVSDNTSDGPRSGSNARWIANVTTIGDARIGTVSPGPFVYRGTTAHLGLGPEADPFAQVKIVADANDDGIVDWQDAAIATRDIRPATNGQDDVRNTVITRIPFNIVSQATHPFLRTLDDTKRVALETDNLGQQVLLKGYQAEGHDAAHPDHAGHYNERAGGLKDLTTLSEEAAKWNANIGVHVNVTESYSEAYNFSEELLRMPPQKAWGWMNQSYYIDGPKDLGTRNVLKRFQEFRDEAPENLNWLYIDVYYPDGWEGQRLGAELQKQGWVVGTEWSNKFPDYSIWSHWATDENYGGQDNKGLNSQYIRFVENSYRDTFNPHPILSNANVVEFEGWAGNVNHNGFIKNIWERNLPTKSLQQSDIMSWTKDTITFRNGTVATSPLASIDGKTIPTNRTIKYDGATVYEQGRYLLPWTDGDDRLYHYNPAGGSSTWTLTDSYAGQSALSLFKLTDTGRVKVADLAVAGGKVTIDAEANTAYVLYPSTSVPAAKAPNWGQASHIVDPGFFSGTLDAYQVSGEASIEKTDRDNYQAVLGAGASSISQALDLPAGTYSAWAWIEVEPGTTRPVDVSVTGTGVSAAGYQSEVEGAPTTSITSSTALNSTASDEKLRTYFQRVRVTFTSTGSPATFTIAAGEGEAKVRIDDLRVVASRTSGSPRTCQPAPRPRFPRPETSRAVRPST
ncbi:endo-alpha-N-acetylgalactosaminidase family protein [Bowdeniella massiliensis]|uniref:endo-alpha-N-acetylgalactosaminidase family protein n=1 Tax=Bowdeniella massiliensis TaxID=2932264 RepID=UPI002028BA08